MNVVLHWTPQIGVLSSDKGKMPLIPMGLELQLIHWLQSSVKILLLSINLCHSYTNLYWIIYFSVDFLSLRCCLPGCMILLLKYCLACFNVNCVKMVTPFMFFMLLNYASVSGSQYKYWSDCTKPPYLKICRWQTQQEQVTNTVWSVQHCKVL